MIKWIKLSAAIDRALARAHRNELKNECRRLIKLDRIRGINIRCVQMINQK